MTRSDGGRRSGAAGPRDVSADHAADGDHGPAVTGDPASGPGGPAGPRGRRTGRGQGSRLRILWRFLVVVARFLPLAATYLRDRRRYLLVGGSRTVTPADQRRRARRLKDTLVDLGPTFIKFGQILSTRPDALPATYVEVLSELQDKVPPDDWAEIRPVVEAELGPVDERFDSFDTAPISGASLGQVYTAEVDGRRVAVKVLRPNIRAVVEADLRVIGALVPALVRFAPEGQAFTLENLAEEFGDTIREEMDYVHEAAMLEEIGANFADDPTIRVPEYLPTHSTDRVLTMEYVEGVKIDDVERIDEMGLDRTALVRRLEEAYIRMIIEDGRFHADPHPGNLAVQPDGTVVFYDFGMTGRIDDRTRELLLDFYIALANDDIDAVIDAFVALDALDPAADREVMREVFDVAIEGFRGEDIDQYRVQELVSAFEGELYDFPMRLPQNLALVVRVSTVLDGVCRTLDPEFDFIAVVTEYVREQGHAEEGVERVAERVADRVRASARSLPRVPRKLDRALTRADRGDLPVAAAPSDGNGVLAGLARRLALGVALAGNVLVVAALYAFATPVEAGAAAVGLLVLGGVLRRSFRRSRGVGGTPQFTRHNLRQRREGRDR